ncbi:hypothetical protein H310_00277 [Aphanomyces invadans]|uniref:EF-hand domain-containing protein n=1 Tax=Aphanomyces invadans TaxID=157072 RepID=A0A024UVW9_9STRA|nr:hypothetical protein H310_00277 [Aphanomyces invadans]ETW09798.1 hypothetical protein H310_00277 [Aphanomyces invadans]|eukprot:XP_008861209.1 hypothetical protein H310_00277 [Aphanomyces invadans]
MANDGDSEPWPTLGVSPTKPKWGLAHVETLLREKILERTKLHDGKFVYQQAYRLLEVNRGKGIDFASFRHAVKVTLALDVSDDDMTALFRKYDRDGNGTIELYEFIDRVLPQDYDPNVQSWVEKSVERSDAQFEAMREADRRAFLGSRTFQDADNCRRSVDDIRRDISCKLQQRIPKCIDRLRSAFKLLHSGANAPMCALDFRQSVRNTLGIALTEEQTHGLLQPYMNALDGTVDVQALLQSLFQTENKVQPSELRDGLFVEVDASIPETPHYGKRHIVPGKGEPMPDRYQKRVHGYFKTKHKNSNPLQLQKPPPPRRRTTTKFQVPSVATKGGRHSVTTPLTGLLPVEPSKPPAMARSFWARIKPSLPARPGPTPPEDVTKPNTRPTVECSGHGSIVAVATTTHRRPSPRLMSPVRVGPQPADAAALAHSINALHVDYEVPRVAVSHPLQLSAMPYKSNKPNWRISENTFSCR